MGTSKRAQPVLAARRTSAAADPFSEAELDAIEVDHPEGLGVQQIVDAFVAKGERLTEATFRKYVQLGLLPRSRRVGRKGKHRGSQGLYPATAIRQLVHLRHLMNRGFTIEEIQREFLFVRGDIEALGRQMSRVYADFEAAIKVNEPTSDEGESSLVRQLEEAQAVGEDLLQRLEDMERRLTMDARMSRAAL